jgi:hypothetical protein
VSAQRNRYPDGTPLSYKFMLRFCHSLEIEVIVCQREIGLHVTPCLFVFVCACVYYGSRNISFKVFLGLAKTLISMVRPPYNFWHVNVPRSKYESSQSRLHYHHKHSDRRTELLGLFWNGRRQIQSPKRCGIFCLPHTRRWIKSKTSPIALYNIHHRQNPIKSISDRRHHWRHRPVFPRVSYTAPCGAVGLPRGPLRGKEVTGDGGGKPLQRHVSLICFTGYFRPDIWKLVLLHQAHPSH